MGYRSAAVKVSAVIPTLNEAPWIAEAIARAWTAGADEVIVCDGGSNDATLEIVRQQRCRLVQTAQGRAVQQNAGARLATGDVVLFLHADNWLATGAIDQIRRLPARRRFVCGAFEQRIEAPGRVFRWLELGDALRVRMFGLAYGDQGIFVRREAFEAVGGYPRQELMENIAISVLLRRLSAPLCLREQCLTSARRWEHHGVLRSIVLMWWLRLQYAFGVAPARLARIYGRSGR